MHNLAFVPFERLKLPPQNLIILVLLIRPLFPDQLVGHLPRQVDRNDHFGQPEASGPRSLERICSGIADIVENQVVPEGARKLLSEESAVHDHLHEEDEEEDDADGREDPPENLLEQAQANENAEGDAPLDAGEVVVDVEDQELRVGDESDHHENNHVDVPFEAEVQQDLRVSQRFEMQLQLIREVFCAVGV